MKKIVDTEKEYHYEVLIENIKSLQKKYPFLRVGTIGKSTLGLSIPYIRIGIGKKEVFYSAAIHANEWITSIVLMKYIEDFCFAYATNSKIGGYDAKTIFNQTSIYFVPMCNPDGVNLVTGKVNKNSSFYRKTKQIAEEFPTIPFPSGWKANIQGVDLNLQFPACWEKAKKIKFLQGYVKPAPRDYVGCAPLICPESFALYQFTRHHLFHLVLAYHTQGKEIYWQFQNCEAKGAEEIGKEFEKVSGYQLATVPINSSYAGYKDWFLQEYQRFGFTIEAGIGSNPLPISQFDEIYRDNIGILTLGTIL